MAVVRSVGCFFSFLLLLILLPLLLLLFLPSFVNGHHLTRTLHLRLRPQRGAAGSMC